MHGTWKVIVAVPFAILAACSSHNAATDSASSAGVIVPDTSALTQDTSAAIDTSKMDSTRADSMSTMAKRHAAAMSRPPSKKKY